MHNSWVNSGQMHILNYFTTIQLVMIPTVCWFNSWSEYSIKRTSKKVTQLSVIVSYNTHSTHSWAVILWWPFENTWHLQSITQCIHNLVGVALLSKQHIQEICCKHVFDRHAEADFNDKNGQLSLQIYLQVYVHLKVKTLRYCLLSSVQPVRFFCSTPDLLSQMVIIIRYHEVVFKKR